MSRQHPRKFDARRVLPIVPGLLPDEVVKSASVVPIVAEDGSNALAALESCDDETLERVRFICNRELNVVVVAEEAMRYAIERYCSQRPN
jgi:hypothetical protein